MRELICMQPPKMKIPAFYEISCRQLRMLLCFLEPCGLEIRIEVLLWGGLSKYLADQK